MPSAQEDARITAAALADPDALPLTSEQLQAMRPMRGRPKAENRKMLVSVRYSAEVIDWFKATGEGWQSRMDQVLRDYISRH